MRGAPVKPTAEHGSSCFPHDVGARLHPIPRACNGVAVL
jgi:hypothetical protein